MDPGRDLKGEAFVILADVFDEDSLNSMCSKAKIVLNCVGPVSSVVYINQHYHL